MLCGEAYVRYIPVRINVCRLLSVCDAYGQACRFRNAHCNCHCLPLQWRRAFAIAISIRINSSNNTRIINTVITLWSNSFIIFVFCVSVFQRIFIQWQCQCKKRYCHCNGNEWSWCTFSATSRFCTQSRRIARATHSHQMQTSQDEKIGIVCAQKRIDNENKLSKPEMKLIATTSCSSIVRVRSECMHRARPRLLH